MIIIGDVHGKIKQYFDIILECEKSSQTSICVGDLGFRSEYTKLYYKFEHYAISPMIHRFFSGNHDSQDHIPPQSLGNFGYFKEFDVPFFFVRGAYSINHVQRVESVSWWRNEELDYDQCSKCVEIYERIKPDIMITHDAPLDCQQFIMSHHDEKSRTNTLLQMLLEIHQPQRWFHGHHHVDLKYNYMNT